MRRTLVFIVALLAISAADARAQMSMGSFRGYLTAHLGAITGPDLTNERLAAGAAVAVHEPDGWGAELDFGHSSDAVSGLQVLDVTTYTVSGARVRPSGLVRPFGLLGAGVVQVNGCNAPCSRAARTYDLGLSGGGGVFVVPHDAFALRADVRYFYTSADHADLRRPENFSFWRVSVGATFIWSITP